MDISRRQSSMIIIFVLTGYIFLYNLYIYSTCLFIDYLLVNSRGRSSYLYCSLSTEYFELSCISQYLISRHKVIGFPDI